MPLSVRAKGVSLSTATNWVFNWIVGEVTPYLQEHIEWRLYYMHATFCVCSCVLGEYLRSGKCKMKMLMQRMKCISVCSLSSCCWLLNEVGYLVYPETKGVPLEEMDAVFGEGARISTACPLV